MHQPRVCSLHGPAWGQCVHTTVYHPCLIYVQQTPPWLLVHRWITPKRSNSFSWARSILSCSRWYGSDWAEEGTVTVSARQGLKQETSIWSRQRTTAVRAPLTTFVFPTYDTMFIPYRTFSSMSGDFVRAMVCILARRSRVEIPKTRPNEPDTPWKRTKKIRLRIYRTQIRSSVHDIVVISSWCFVSDLIS